MLLKASLTDAPASCYLMGLWNLSPRRQRSWSWERCWTWQVGPGPENLQEVQLSSSPDFVRLWHYGLWHPYTHNYKCFLNRVIQFVLLSTWLDTIRDVSWVICFAISCSNTVAHRTRFPGTAFHIPKSNTSPKIEVPSMWLYKYLPGTQDHAKCFELYHMNEYHRISNIHDTAYIFIYEYKYWDINK